MSTHTTPMLPGASDWCQRHTSGAVQTWRHRRDGGFNSRRYDVAPVSAERGRTFVAARHYLGTWPAVRLSYGMWDGPDLVGVLALAVPVRSRVLTKALPDLIPTTQSLDLARLVLDDTVPANGESWFVAHALRMAAGKGIGGVVMFSDPLPQWRAGRQITPGHVGIIYQALNATYHGRGTARLQTILPDGTVLHDRSAAKVRSADPGAGGVVAQLVALGASPPERGATPSEQLATLRDWTPQARALWLRDALTTIGATRRNHPGTTSTACAPPATGFTQARGTTRSPATHLRRHREPRQQSLPRHHHPPRRGEGPAPRSGQGSAV